MDNPIDGTDGKLGHGFMYVSTKVDPEYKRE